MLWCCRWWYDINGANASNGGALGAARTANATYSNWTTDTSSGVGGRFCGGGAGTSKTVNNTISGGAGGGGNASANGSGAGTVNSGGGGGSAWFNAPEVQVDLE